MSYLAVKLKDFKLATMLNTLDFAMKLYILLSVIKLNAFVCAIKLKVLLFAIKLKSGAATASKFLYLLPGTAIVESCVNAIKLL